jgi:uncharacterized protein (TIGR02145 family)
MKNLSINVFLISLIVLASCQKGSIQLNEDLDYNTFTDTRDGQVYHSIKIGEQIWMAENLRYHYSSGNNSHELIYCEYGRMYLSGRVKYCPDGWHIPDSLEWQMLIDYLGGAKIAGGKLKEAGNSHWNNPNEGATNISGFTALPAGYSRSMTGLIERNKTAQFWSSTINPDEDNIYGNSYYYISLSSATREITSHYSFDDVDEDYELRSIRCVKDSSH